MKKSLRILSYILVVMLLSLTAVCGAEAEVRVMQVKPGTGHLNLRDEPSTDGKLLGSLAAKTQVTVIEIKNGWAAVMADGKSGYVYASYLTDLSSDPSGLAKGWRTIGKAMTVNASNLYLRRDPSTSSPSMGIYSKGKQVEVVAGNGTWYKVQIGDKTGYMMASFLKEEKGVTPVKGTTVYVNATHVNLRSEPTTKSKALDVLPSGTTLTLLSTSGDWAEVRFGNQTGYIFRDYITETKVTPSSDTVTVDNSYASYVNLRSTPNRDNNSNILAFVKNGTKMSVLQRGATWTKVMYNGLVGYMLTKMISYKK